MGSQDHTIFGFDNKNIIDYLALLQVRPLGKTGIPKEQGAAEPLLRRFPHLIVPALFVGSMFTSYWAIRELSRSGSASRAAVTFCWSCFGLQTLYSLRPLRRFTWRFFGAKRTSDVYN